MKSRGIVIETKENRAIIRFIKESACGGNSASCGGCKSKPIEIEIENSLDAKVGDIVEVLSDSSEILLSAFVLYIMPLFVLVTVYLILKLFLGETVSTVLAIICFFLSFCPIRLYGKKIKPQVKLIAKEN